MASAATIFENMPQAFNAEKAGDLDATVQFDLTGEDGGTWIVVVTDGNCTGCHNPHQPGAMSDDRRRGGGARR